MATDSPAWRAAPLASVRAFIGAAFTPPPVPATLGRIALHEHQRHAAARLREAIAQFGGAVLADPTGAGKTFTALAAAADARNLLVVAPAVLRERWRAALSQAGVAATVVSMESLARDRRRRPEHDWVIIDEAHHFRNPRTRRYHAVARLCRRARVVLVTATPVHNRLGDARAQVALFRGDEAYAMTAAEIGAFVVREGPPPRIPALDGPHLVRLAHDDEAVLGRLLALPSPLRALDAGDAGVLATFTLVRRWASSRAALAATLRRRLATGEALLAAASAGRTPTRRELTAWAFDGEAVQLAFTELIVEASAGERAQDDGEDVGRHLRAIRELLTSLDDACDADQARADAVRQIRARHRGERIVAFTSHADSAIALARRLRRDGGVALLTGDRVEGASGRFSRAEVLAQMADPARRTPTHERIDLLIATDVLSEGVDMLAVSVVVHLDLPWNPAVLDQRVGRARRLGSPHERVSVYALAPPASAERLLDLEARLTRKLSVAASVVGQSSRILPELTHRGSQADATDAGASNVESRIAHVLREWAHAQREADDGPEIPAVTLVAAAESGDAGVVGWLALLHDGTRLRLVAASRDREATGDRAAILAALEAITRCSARAPLPDETGEAVAAARAHLGSLSAHRTIHSTAPRTRTRSRILRHAALVLSAAPPAERARLASLAAAARAATRARWSAGDQAAFDALAHDPPHEWRAAERWLRSVAQSAANEAEVDRQRPHLLALILFGSQDASRRRSP